MKRLPLFLAIFICGITLAFLSPIIGILWLLGGNDPLDNFITAIDNICFPEKKK